MKKDKKTSVVFVTEEQQLELDALSELIDDPEATEEERSELARRGFQLRREIRANAKNKTPSGK